METGESYTITFKVGYKTDFGQSLCIVGNIEELGAWKQFKAAMKWTEGHVWKYTLTTTRPYFQYKYVVLEHG